MDFSSCTTTVKALVFILFLGSYYTPLSAENIVSWVNDKNVSLKCEKNPDNRFFNTLWTFYRHLTSIGRPICNVSRGLVTQGFMCSEDFLTIETVEEDHAGRYICKRMYEDEFKDTTINVYVVLDTMLRCDATVNETSVVVSISFPISGGRNLNLMPDFSQNGLPVSCNNGQSAQIMNGTFTAWCSFNYTSDQHKASFSAQVPGPNLSCSVNLTTTSGRDTPTVIHNTFLGLLLALSLVVSLIVFVYVIWKKKLYQKCLLNSNKELLGVAYSAQDPQAEAGLINA